MRVKFKIFSRTKHTFNRIITAFSSRHYLMRAHLTISAPISRRIHAILLPYAYICTRSASTKNSAKSQFRGHPQRFMYLHIQKIPDLGLLRGHTFTLKKFSKLNRARNRHLSYPSRTFFHLCLGAPCEDMYRYISQN